MTWSSRELDAGFPFSFLRPWTRVRRIVSGRRYLSDGFIEYTTPEAIEADFGPSPLPELMMAMRAFR